MAGKEKYLRMTRIFRLALIVVLAVSAVALPAAAERGAASGWYVVSFDDRITSRDRARLGDAGARAIQYLPDDRYVAWIGQSSHRAIAALPNIVSVVPLPAPEKIAVAPAGGGDSPVTVSVFGPRAQQVWTRLEATVGAVRGYPSDSGSAIVDIVVQAAAPDLDTIASDPDVLSIGPAGVQLELLDEGAAQIVAGNIAKNLPVPGYRKFLKRLGLDGSGVTIAIADSGIDDNHPDLAGRVKARVDYTALPDYRDTDGHGTHVAGIAGGSGTGFEGAEDPDGFAYGQGIAPAVSFVDVGVLGIIEETVGLDEFPPFERASRFASRNGAVGWNASWGSGEGDRAGYTPVARTMDVIARDADWKKPGAQPFALVFAAGNSGQNGPGAPSEAKNLIAIAASRSHRAGDIDTIASFSSRGPTKDGRYGPTVAAPGEEIVSTRSSSGSVLCNTPPIEASPLAIFYGVCSGTSMAAPQGTGSVALITQWWKKRHDGAVPSPAMTKALLINSATDMGPRDIPNYEEGWGRIALKSLFDPGTRRVYIDQTRTFDDRGDSYRLSIKPADPRKPLKVTLAWSDAPGAPNARRALVNDLDLTLRRARGPMFWGNGFKNGRSIAGGSADRREVVENVFIDDPRGVYELSIKAFNLPGDGIPYRGDATDQDFALVLSNATIVRR